MLTTASQFRLNTKCGITLPFIQISPLFGDLKDPVSNEAPTNGTLWHAPSPMIVQDYEQLSFEWSFFMGYVPVTPSTTEPSSEEICLDLQSM
jgi:hypothetical protein